MAASDVRVAPGQEDREVQAPLAGQRSSFLQPPPSGPSLRQAGSREGEQQVLAAHCSAARPAAQPKEIVLLQVLWARRVCPTGPQ